jgi:copper chaperone
MQDVTLKIEGMSCGHCVAAVAGALKSVEGVEVKEVAIGRAEVSLDPESGALADATSAIETAGYTVIATTP